MGTTTVRSSFNGMAAAPNQTAMSEKQTNTHPKKVAGKRLLATSIKSIRTPPGENDVNVRPGIPIRVEVQFDSAKRKSRINAKALGLNGSMVGNRNVSIAWFSLLTNCCHISSRSFDLDEKKKVLDKKLFRTMLSCQYVRHRTPPVSSSRPLKVGLTKLSAPRAYSLPLVAAIISFTMRQFASKNFCARTSNTPSSPCGRVWYDSKGWRVVVVGPTLSKPSSGLVGSLWVAMMHIGIKVPVTAGKSCWTRSAVAHSGECRGTCITKLWPMWRCKGHRSTEWKNRKVSGIMKA
mmetsp:Transcript_58464/g.163023  ORF Transcript_58464/g.163023 Transcript_58464/m.163023 type:complete len:292 (-) Transcript_58464:1408-2283(-)